MVVCDYMLGVSAVRNAFVEMAFVPPMPWSNFDLSVTVELSAASSIDGNCFCEGSPRDMRSPRTREAILACLWVSLLLKSCVVDLSCGIS